jgi:uracil phosphoribosyltransferase
MIRVLGKENSIANDFLRELRDTQQQTDRARFRNNLTRLGELMAYEISKKLRYQPQTIQTPLAAMQVDLLAQQPVLITVLRAGLPYFLGFQNLFNQADSGFIGAFRKEDEHALTIQLGYHAAPDLTGKTVLLIDPMLATGKSFIKSIESLQKNGIPAYIHIASLVAAPEGVKFIEDNLKIPNTVWTWALDERLNDQLYIVPGLGDAGDLCFGEKL